MQKKDNNIIFYKDHPDNNLQNADISISEKALAVFEGIGFYIRYFLEKYLNINYQLKFELNFY